MSAFRLRTCLLFLFLSLPAMGCSSHPGWVFRLPANSGPVTVPRELLAGTWVRLVESRYSVANPEVYWKGREWIEITRRGEGADAGFAYEKRHLYAEYYRGELRRRAYSEKGALRLKRGWLLFDPAAAVSWSEMREIKPGEKKAFESSRRILLPDLDVPAMRKEASDASPRALRFFYNSETRGTREQGTVRRLHFITPLTYERFGEIFEHGIYEGCTEPCDIDSKIFRAALRKYNVNSFHRHGYIKKELPAREVF